VLIVQSTISAVGIEACRANEAKRTCRRHRLTTAFNPIGKGSSAFWRNVTL